MTTTKKALLGLSLIAASVHSYADYHLMGIDAALSSAVKQLSNGEDTNNFNWRIFKEKHIGKVFGMTSPTEQDQNGDQYFDTYLVAMQSKQQPSQENYTFIVEAGDLLTVNPCLNTGNLATASYYNPDKTGAILVECDVDNNMNFVGINEKNLLLNWWMTYPDFLEQQGGMGHLISNIEYVAPSEVNNFNQLPYGSSAKRNGDEFSITAMGYSMTGMTSGHNPVLDIIPPDEVIAFKQQTDTDLKLRFVFPKMSGLSFSDITSNGANAPSITVADIKSKYSIKISETQEYGDDVRFDSEQASPTTDLKNLSVTMNPRGAAGNNVAKVVITDKETGALKIDYIAFYRDMSHPGVNFLPASATVEVDPKDAYWYSDIRIQNTGQVAIKDIELSVVTGVFDFINTGSDATVTPELGGNSDGLTAAKAGIRFTTPLAPGASIRWPSVDVDGEKGVKFFTATIHYADGTSSTGDLVDVADTDDSNPKLFRLESSRL